MTHVRILEHLGHHPEYADPKNRLASFSNRNFVVRFNKEKFAQAGFYAVNHSTLKCYFCTLEIWLRVDEFFLADCLNTEVNPWKYHEENSPQCKFLEFAKQKRQRILENKKKEKNHGKRDKRQM